MQKFMVNKKKFSGQKPLKYWISRLFGRMEHQFIYQRSLFASVENKKGKFAFHNGAETYHFSMVKH